MDRVDVVELCGLLQCLGFTIKSLDTSDCNASQDGGIGKSVIVHCQSSGLQVVMESGNTACSCPVSKENSGFWQVSGVTGGKQLEKESGSTLLCTLSKTQKEQMTEDLLQIMKKIRDQSNAPELPHNKSKSMLELKTPEKALFEVKLDTPTRYRSLDTLTAGKQPQELPTPGTLQRRMEPSSDQAIDEDVKLPKCQRQSTYTLASTPGSMRRRNKTSSPIHHQATVLEGLIAAEKAAENLRNELSMIIKQMDERCIDSSMSSLALDVSKISVFKGTEPTKSQFASSPNLTGQVISDDLKYSRLRRIDSASTSNLGSKPTPNKESKLSRLRKISPNIFRSNKQSPNIITENSKVQDRSGKLNSLFKAKIVIPVRAPKPDVNANIPSATKKKFSHVKSTIPRPLSRKE